MKKNNVFLLIGLLFVPSLGFSKNKNSDYTTVTQALGNISKKVPNSYSTFRKDIDFMDKIWGTEAFVFIYQNHKETIQNPSAKMLLLEGLIRFDQLNDPRVREILTENKNNEYVGFWIVEKLKLDNTEAESKAKTVLKNYTEATKDDEVLKAIAVLGNIKDGLVPYKDTLIKIAQRNKKGETSPDIAKLFLGKMGESEFLLKNFYSTNNSRSEKMNSLQAMVSANNIRNAIQQDKSKRNTLLKDFRSIMQKEKDPEYRSLALKGITELLDYSRTDPGSDAEVRKFLGEVADSTTETQQIKDKAKEALQR